MKTGALAARYAEALFAAAEEQGVSAEIGEQLAALGRELNEDAAFRGLVLDKSMPAPRKKQIFHDLLGSSLHPYVVNFFCLLFDKDREDVLEQIIAVYRQLEQRKQGLLTVQLTTAKPIGAEEEAALKAALSKAYGQQVTFTHEVDPALLGGAAVTIGDTTIDGSLKSRLQSLRRQLNS